MTGTAGQWGIVLNETGLFSSGGGAAGASDWWIRQRYRFESSNRLRVLAQGFLGDTVEIGPLDKEDAEFARDHMIKHGIHKGLLKLRRWKADPVPPRSRRSRRHAERSSSP